MTRVAVIPLEESKVGNDQTLAGWWLQHISLIAARRVGSVLIVDPVGDVAALLVDKEELALERGELLVAQRAANISVSTGTHLQSLLRAPTQVEAFVESYDADLTLVRVEGGLGGPSNELLSSAGQWVLVGRDDMGSVRQLHHAFERVQVPLAERTARYSVVEFNRRGSSARVMGLFPEEFRLTWGGGRRASRDVLPQNDDLCLGVVDSYALLASRRTPLYDLPPEDHGHGLVDPLIVEAWRQSSRVVDGLLGEDPRRALVGPATQAAERQVVRLSETGEPASRPFPISALASRQRASWVVAPPGAGKSFEADRLGERSWVVVKLGKRTAADLPQYLPPSCTQPVVLDEVDQWGDGIDRLAERLTEWLDTAKPPAVVLLSRPTGRDPRIVEVVREAFGHCHLHRLEPLSWRQIEHWALAHFKQGGADFLAALEAGAHKSLAALPLTLAFLARCFEADDRLTNDRVRLYDGGLPRVARWPVTDPPVDASEVVGIAEKLAWVATINAKHIAEEPARGAEDLSELCRAFDISEGLARRALGTALFEEVQAQPFCIWRFAHHSFAEFLAARHATRQPISRAALRRFLAPEGDRVQPHLEGFEQWLIELGALPLDTLGSAIRRHELGWPVQSAARPEWLAQLVTAHRAGRFHIRRIWKPGMFVAPGTDAVARRMLQDEDPDIRTVGVRVRSALNATGDGEWALAIARDPSQPDRVRREAFLAVKSAAPTKMSELLSVLREPGNDPQLRGQLLVELWPEHLSGLGFMDALGRLELVDSDVRWFLEENAADIAESVPWTEIEQALRWAVAHANVPNGTIVPERWPFVTLLLARTWTPSSDDRLRDAIADALLAWARYHHRYVDDAPVVWRRVPTKFNTDIAARVVTRSRSAEDLSDAFFAYPWLVPETVFMLDQLEAALGDPETVDRWVEGLRFAQWDDAFKARVRANMGAHAKLAKWVSWWDAPRQEPTQPRPRAERQRQEPVATLDAELERIREDPRHWPYFVHAWRWLGTEWRPFNERAYWRDLDDSTRARLSANALDWLATAPVQDWLVGFARRQIVRETWIFVHHRGQVPDENLWIRWSEFFLSLYGDSGPAQALRNAARAILGPPSIDTVRRVAVQLPQERVTVLAEAANTGWTDALAALALEWLDDPDSDDVRGLVRVILRTAVPAALTAWIESHLSDPTVLQASFEERPGLAWCHVWDRFVEDDDYARELLGDQIRLFDFDRMPGPEVDRAVLFERMWSLFPDEQHRMGVVHEVSLADRVRRACVALVDQLVSNAEVEVLEDIVARLPRASFLPARLDQARRRRLELSEPRRWTPQELASATGRPATELELVRLILDLLEELQGELNGEYSFYKDYFTEADLLRPVREEQATASLFSRIRTRLRPYGVRFDFEVQGGHGRHKYDVKVFGDGVDHAVKVEVKWIDNRSKAGFEQSMDLQLGGYLDDGEHGIYLVLWNRVGRKGNPPRKRYEAYGQTWDFRYLRDVRDYLELQSREMPNRHPFVLDLAGPASSTPVDGAQSAQG